MLTVGPGGIRWCPFGSPDGRSRSGVQRCRLKGLPFRADEGRPAALATYRNRDRSAASLRSGVRKQGIRWGQANQDYRWSSRNLCMYTADRSGRLWHFVGSTRLYPNNFQRECFSCVIAYGAPSASPVMASTAWLRRSAPARQRSRHRSCSPLFVLFGRTGPSL